MNHKEINSADTRLLIRLYAEAAAMHGKASAEGDYENANHQYDIIATVYRELRARGRDNQLTLLGLLQDNNPSVRLWAASHALEFAPEEGEPVLVELYNSERGLHRLNAEMTLEEWRKGALVFP